MHTYYYALKRIISRLGDASRFGIRKSDLVLDLGSGQDPHPRANVLCDKFTEDSQERACGAGLIIDRTFVLAEATATPFPDKAFDFVFCSHLLEHMPDPELLIMELQRISKRGYIETPSKLYEKLCGWNFHYWFIELKGGELVLEPKTDSVFDDDLHQWYSGLIKTKSGWKFFIPHLDELALLTKLVWEDEIRYTILGNPLKAKSGFRNAEISEIDTRKVMNITKERTSWARRIQSLMSRFARRPSEARVRQLLSSLVCPACRAGLSKFEHGYRCEECGVNIVSHADVRLLLKESAE